MHRGGLRTAIRTAVHYIGEWLVGIGAVAIDDHLEDTAMANCAAPRSAMASPDSPPTNGVVVDDALLDRSLPRNSPSFVSTWASPRGPTGCRTCDWSSLDDLILFPIAVAGNA